MKAEFLTSMDSMVVTKQPPITELRAKNGDLYTFFSVKYGEGTITIVAFDDERKESPYKRVKKLNLKKDSLVNLVCSLSLEMREGVDTDCWSPRFKLEKIDYTIPIEMMQQMKSAKPAMPVIPLEFD